jgi:hypothetical protein
MADSETQFMLDWQRALLDDARRNLARATVVQREAEQQLNVLSRSAAPDAAHQVENAKKLAMDAAAARQVAAKLLREEATQLHQDLFAHLRATQMESDARVELAKLDAAEAVRLRNDLIKHAGLSRNKADTVLKAASTDNSLAAKLRNDLSSQVPVTPEQEIGRLAADSPIVLLPVRLETRFHGSELLLRVYPDDIFAEAHEPELTDQEISDGERYWRDAWQNDEAERAAWKVLIGAVGAPRAAWIAQTLSPTNIRTERPAQPPVFPAPSRRVTSWTRAAEARLLPDRWLVLCYRNGTEIHRVSGAPIVEPLALTMAPTIDASDRSPLTDDGLLIDGAARWTVDFAAAEQVGMALRISLSQVDATDGFDRILVLGVKSSLTPERSALELENLLTQHRFDRGVAFVPQGTPTNNSESGQTEYPLKDPDGSISYAVERQGLDVKADQDGGRLVKALGLPISAAKHIFGADRDGDGPASAMARSLWPTTLGYFLEQLMAPEFSPDTIAATQNYFVQHVRGRGPLPAFRVGNTPYGVLPVSSLDKWQPTNPESAWDRELPKALSRLRPIWFERINEVPRVGRTDDPDGDLLTILGMDASTREVRVRSVLGEDTQWNLFGFFGFNDAWQIWLDEGQALAAQVFERLGHPEWCPRIARFNFGKAWLFPQPLVAEDPLSEHDGLTPNYIDWIARATVPELNSESLLEGMKLPSVLLYRLLRHAALLEYHDAAFELLERYKVLSSNERIEPELVGLPTKERRPTRLERLAQPLPELTGQTALHVFLENPKNAPLLHTLLPDGSVLGLREALKILAPLPTAELDRLCGETLDVVSHRLDAWITSLATKRLGEMRNEKPDGCYIGAFGWIEDLRPKTAAEIEKLPDGQVAVLQSDNGGFVHAPSMTHAATAAVLRNAYLSRRGTEQSRYAVDLSSSRVRLGRFVLDAVREGQPLGAVLGYCVERGLHERHQDIWIAPLRSLYPLVAKKSNDPANTNEPAEQIAARNVVDGLTLRRAYQEGSIPWATLGLSASDAGRVAIEAELVALDAATDAVSDLLLAESVYQIVKGSPTVASATLDAMAQGTVRPPDPEIITQPRSGTPLTHRVAIVIGGAAAPLPAGWPAGQTIRAATEPCVDAWLGGLFGDPAQVRCSVELGPVEAPIGNTIVSLDELGLRPIDVLALARAQTQKVPTALHAAASELDRRIQDAAYADLAVADEVETRITYELPASADRMIERSFGDVLEVARAVSAVLAKSRPLGPIDLVAEDQGGQAQTANLQPDVAVNRAKDLREEVSKLINNGLSNGFASLLAVVVAAPEEPEFDLTSLRNQMRAVALAGVPMAYPQTSRGNDIKARRNLIAQATSVKKELERRLQKADGLLADADSPEHAADPAFRISTASEIVKTLLGADMPFLPLFKPAAANELNNALTNSSNPLFISATDVQREIRRFEMVSARVRPAIDAWRRLELVSNTLGSVPAPRVVAQVPYDATARWVALPFPSENDRPKPGRTSLLLYRVTAPAATDTWSGLLLDAWSEFIPSPKEQTGISFHYDNPGAEAAQTILVAVPPTHAERWDLESLVATLHETLDLAKIRAVDSELLGKLGQLLPAIYLSDSTEEVTVRTSFAGILRKEIEIKGM